ncbi:HAD-IA family hydrolase [Sulfitobacter sp. R18_1]|uniref:HAD family hydrolase n=1 Tax=Sulfitobacter sp. R18_1 TaxID=2821104 RepID=UPI001ADD0597|nr:HAD-IA family hydrolase [Sulfitobacter sp. R18_1]MBO9428565.1 HAD-IA family hydrolase [Sulfitobacter sp. R18_1]
MKILFWTPPWASQGDPLFFKNCTEKHLIPQANMLGAAGHEVDFVLPQVMSGLKSIISDDVNVVRLTKKLEMTAPSLASEEIFAALYRAEDENLLSFIADSLKPCLAEHYDAIMLWENPVPFLGRLFPEAAILHQMPGTFARAPFPATVTIDPEGLYRDGILHNRADSIQSVEGHSEDLNMAREYMSKVRSVVGAMKEPELEKAIDRAGDYAELSLLPLQISKHYTFRVDTGYSNQYDLLTDVLAQSNPEEGLVATQYVHRLNSEKVLNAEVRDALNENHGNLIFDEAFDRIDSVSQLLMPRVDMVYTAASSIGLQAMAWRRKLKVVQPTFLERFGIDHELEGVRWEDRCDNTTAFLLGRYQPVADLVKSDPEFMTAYLEAIVAWKKDANRSVETLPRFADLYSGYSSKLLSGFNIPAKKTKGGEKDYRHYLAQFERNVQEADIVTFDIFDTLIRRPCEKPGDLYKFLEPIVYDLSNGMIANFAQVRGNCERMARDEQEGKEFDEITLDQIYSLMQDTYQISDALIGKIKQAEIDLEIQVSAPRDFGMRLLEVAQAAKKPVYLISDMYLDFDTIEKMVKKSGIIGYDKLYLSADYGLRKHDGRLFTLVLDELGVAPEKMLHVGDNKNNDATQAEILGIKVLHWPAAIEKMRRNGRYKAIYDPRNGAGQMGRSAIAGMTANYLFDNANTKIEFDSLFSGDPVNLGYAALGPILTGYVSWIYREAKRDGISDLFFFSREGYVLCEVYKRLFEGVSDAPKPHYFYTSRRCVRVAALRTVDDITALAAQPFDPGVKLSKLMKGRFGVVLSEAVHGAMIAACGFSDSDQALKNDADTKSRFAKLALMMETAILANAAKEREAYELYIKQTGYLTCDNPGVVDVGWKANIQGALTELTGRPAVGYYYATTSDAMLWARKGHQHRSFLGDYISEKVSPSAVVQNRHIFEYLTCHTDPTLIHFEMENGKPSPVFNAEYGRHVRKGFIEKIHSGALTFASEYRRSFGELSEGIMLDPYLCERVFASFTQNPAEADALLMEGHLFEDIMGGVSGKSLMTKPAPKRKPKKVATKASPRISVRGSDLDGATLSERLEKAAVMLLVNDSKYAKYCRNRDRFFKDSRSKFGRAYYNIGRM